MRELNAKERGSQIAVLTELSTASLISVLADSYQTENRRKVSMEVWEGDKDSHLGPKKGDSSSCEKRISLGCLL